MKENEEEIEFYGDEYIASYERKIPRWLFWSYFLWIAVGTLAFCLFWNGSYGWFDRGYWNELQRAANTTFPIINQDDPLKT